MQLIQTILNNKHTSGAALIFFALGVAAIIWPEAKPKLDQIQELAVMYGLFAAGDGGQKKPVDALASQGQS